MPDATPIKRQWTLLRSLSSRQYGLTVREMAAEAGVNDKTIRRDLELFRAIGVPLEETAGDFGRKRWRIKSWNQPPLCFGFDEALALYLGRQFLEPLAGTLFWDAAQRAFRKIRASLGERALEYLTRHGGSFHLTTVGFSDYARKGDLIDALTMAIEDSKAVHIDYTTALRLFPTMRSCGRRSGLSFQ
jgi:predicted DNA-binding transcriptional regulator YafY